MTPEDAGLDPDASGDDVEYTCDPTRATSCELGTRCAPVRDQGTHTVFRCIEDTASLQRWDPCTVVPGGADGCPAGTACLAPDTQGEGSCLPMCDPRGLCDSGSCRAHSESGIAYCEYACDPIIGHCPAELICRQNDQGFGCSQVPIPQRAAKGDGCGESETDDVCGSGLVCQSGARLVGCNHRFCCADLCSLQQAQGACDAQSSCLAFLSPPIPPDLRDVGACLVAAR